MKVSKNAVLTALAVYLAITPHVEANEILGAARLIRGAIGRAVIAETAEGIELGLRITGMSSKHQVSVRYGREVVARYADDVSRALVTSKGRARDFHLGAAPEIEARMARIAEQFRKRIVAEPHLDARALLDELAGEELVISFRAKQIEFIAPSKPVAIDGARKRFLGGVAKAHTVDSALESIAKAEFLDGANLAGLDFSSHELMGALLISADLRYADLMGSRLIYSDLTLARLEGAYLRDAEVLSTEMAGASLDRVDFGNAVLNDVMMAGTELKGASFLGAKLERIDLSGANLMGADFRPAVLGKDVNLQGARYDKYTVFPGGWTHATARMRGMVYVPAR